jgi:hypothetical protein
MTIVKERIEALVVARLASSSRPLSVQEIAKALQRFAPAQHSPTAWRGEVEAVITSLQERRVLDEERRLVDSEELVRRIGKHGGRTWTQLVERIFPALSLGVSGDDAKIHARLSGRDAWTAAIAGRALGLWTQGTPPSLSAVCDAYAWQQLGLGGKPKRCPPEVRAVFLQRELHSDSGPPDRLLRLFAAKHLDAPRPELRALRDTLVRNWLGGRELAPNTNGFAAEVRDVARTTTNGVFGDRKVFISAVWDELRRHRAWVALTLDEFKAKLLRAHRDGDLVLARADLVAAMNPDLVAASETTTDGASFHFIVREDRS